MSVTTNTFKNIYRQVAGSSSDPARDVGSSVWLAKKKQRDAKKVTRLDSSSGARGAMSELLRQNAEIRASNRIIKLSGLAGRYYNYRNNFILESFADKFADEHGDEVPYRSTNREIGVAAEEKYVRELLGSNVDRSYTARALAGDIDKDLVPGVAIMKGLLDYVYEMSQYLDLYSGSADDLKPLIEDRYRNLGESVYDFVAMVVNNCSTNVVARVLSNDGRFHPHLAPGLSGQYGGHMKALVVPTTIV